MDPRELTIYVLAVMPRDAELTCGHLREVGIDARDAGTFDAMLATLTEPIGALLVTDEAVPPGGWSKIATVLGGQPAWSDIPIIVCCRKRRSGVDHVLATSAGNITVVETPVRVSTVLSAAKTALRARRRQYEVRDLLARLEETDRRKDEFLAMLGHELRNPLSAMNLALQLKHMQTPAIRDDRQMQILERQMRTLSRIVDDLLDVSRVTLGKIRLEPSDVDVCELARRCVQALSADAESSGLALRIDAPTCPVFVRGDVVRLEQILANLVTNAIKYTQRGGRIDVVVQPERQVVRLCVKDTGIGIEPEQLSRMFELFAQAKQGLERSRGGLGLGLALVKRLVEQHGGEITAHSEGLGKGSTFAVTLPAQHVERRAEPNTPAAALSEQLRILIVEDNEDARVMLRTLLESHGQLVEDANDGMSGLTAALATPPDVMIVDLGLPKIDGFQLARQIRIALSDAPYLIAMTGYGQPSDRERAIGAGFDAFLVKPVEYAELERVLATTKRRFAGRQRRPTNH